MKAPHLELNGCEGEVVRLCDEGRYEVRLDAVGGENPKRARTVKGLRARNLILLAPAAPATVGLAHSSSAPASTSAAPAASPTAEAVPLTAEEAVAQAEVEGLKLDTSSNATGSRSRSLSGRTSRGGPGTHDRRRRRRRCRKITGS